MPGAPGLIALHRAEGLQSEMLERFVQRATVDVVHVEHRLGLTDDAFHGASAPVVDDHVPVRRQSVACADPGQRCDESAMPANTVPPVSKAKTLMFIVLSLWGGGGADGNSTEPRRVPCRVQTRVRR